MRNFANRRKEYLKMNMPDFYRAMERRDFDEMADIYNEMMRYEKTGSTDGMDRYFFAEILDGYVLKIPTLAMGYIHKMNKEMYYYLTDSYILYLVSTFPFEEEESDLFLRDIKNNNIEAERLVFTGDTISFTPMAIKTLELSVGDIIEIDIYCDIIELNKLKKTVYISDI